MVYYQMPTVYDFYIRFIKYIHILLLISFKHYNCFRMVLARLDIQLQTSHYGEHPYGINIIRSV